MYLGVELARRAVKALLIDDAQNSLARSIASFSVGRPKPGRMEFDPDDLWGALSAAFATLRKAQPQAFDAVKCVGIGSDLHGTILVDRDGRPIRPAILDEDRRAVEESEALAGDFPAIAARTGQAPAPGHAAAVVRWLAAHERKAWGAADLVLQPKDYLLLRLTGRAVADPCDSAWTLWVDAAGRCWCDDSVDASGMRADRLPELAPAPGAVGPIDADAARELGLPSGATIALGTGGDAARALSVGALDGGAGFAALGEAGGLVITRSEAPSQEPARGVVRACHALDGLWLDSASILDAAGCLTWLAGLTGASNEQALLAEAGQVDRDTGSLIYLPFRSGTADPFHDPNAKGVLYGLVETTRRADLTRAVLEGMAMAYAEGREALIAAGNAVGELSVTGTDVRSPFWGRILASALGAPLLFHKDGSSYAVAFGAARLARLALTGETPQQVCTRPAIDFTAQPVPSLASRYAAKREDFRRLFRALQPSFADLP